MPEKEFSLETYPWRAGVDYRAKPELYRVGKGEQGVFICEPYKSEILPHWQFKTIAEAQKSSDTIYAAFLNYLLKGEFVGADMARKFLQMGYTRARRYANYKGGRKYNPENGETLDFGTGDPEKADCAAIFKTRWKAAEAHPDYATQKADWRQRYG